VWVRRSLALADRGVLAGGSFEQILSGRRDTFAPRSRDSLGRGTLPGLSEFRNHSRSTQKRQQFVKLSIAPARLSDHAWGLCTRFGARPRRTGFVPSCRRPCGILTDPSITPRVCVGTGDPDLTQNRRLLRRRGVEMGPALPSLTPDKSVHTVGRRRPGLDEVAPEVPPQNAAHPQGRDDNRVFTTRQPSVPKLHICPFRTPLYGFWSAYPVLHAQLIHTSAAA
jgi:hypothetical protein